jgi:hypothetical protein
VRRLCGACVIVLCCASFAAAQSILDGRRVEFLPSSDHSAVDANGTALVDRYTMQIFPAGGATPYETVELGKPAPEADGYIRVDFIALLPLALTPGQSYEATVTAVGPGGTGTSGRSNTFGLSLPCSFSLSPSGQSFGAAGGTGTFSVATQSTCQWTAVSQAAWLAVTAGASGTGSGSVSYTVGANGTPSTRSGVIQAGGWNFTVTQAAQPAPCTFSVSPTSRTTSRAAGSVSFTVSTASGCAWTAASPVSWAVIASGASGSGPGTVTVSVSKNTGPLRSTTLTIAGQSVTLTQRRRGG